MTAAQQEEREGRGLVENALAELYRLEQLLNTLQKRLNDKGGSSLDDKAFVDVGLQTLVKAKAILSYYGANENIAWIVDKRTRKEASK